MAIIISNEQRSGSVGNTVYSRNKGGSYVRTRAIPTNPNTARQQTVRTQFQSLSSNWSTLTVAQRALWEAYAEAHPVPNRLGQMIVLSGLAMFLRLNFNILDWGGVLIATPPVEAAPNPLVGFSAAIGAAVNLVQIAFSVAIGGGERIQLWQTNPHLINSTPNINQAYFATWSTAGEVSEWTATLKTGIPVGQYATVFARVFAGNGQSSAFVSDSFLSS